MNTQAYSREQNEAWLATLTPEERWNVYVPQGYWPLFIMVALAKRGLLDPKIKPGEQLQILELMEQITDPSFFTSEMLSMIAPASDAECEIVELAHSLDPPGDKRGFCSYKIFTNERVWEFVCALNPSILAAIRWRYESREARPSGAANVTAQAPDAGASDKQASTKAEIAARMKLPAYGAAVEKFHTRRMQQ